jgi:heparan-alpha-glucosaminide N-acetyltransferase
MAARSSGGTNFGVALVSQSNAASSSSFIHQQTRTHVGQNNFAAFGETWIPMLERGCVLLFLWLIVWWMYRRKIFLRI